MKTSNKYSFVTGVVLLALAALFSICLILQPLNFGIGGPGQNIFFLLGNIIFTVYGFSSILIPVFLLLAGLSCFATKWTSKKTMLLITALIPFFTAVFTEKICRFVYNQSNSEFNTVKIVITLITGLMLIIIELLGAVAFAEKINNIAFSNHSNSSIKKDIYEPATDIFDTTLDNVKPEEIILDETESPSLYEQVEDSFAEDSLQTTEQNSELEQKDISESQDITNTEPSDEKTQAPLLTQEEYEALTTFADPESTEMQDPLESENPDNIGDTQIEELEWPNLPPQTQDLPPEYQDTDSLNSTDDSLDFPPSEDTPFENFTSSDQDYSESSETSEDLTTSELISDTPEQKSDESPYSAAHYIDKIVEKPLYPHGISLEDEAPSSEPEQKEEPEPIKKNIYPSRIELSDDNYEEDITLPFPQNIIEMDEPSMMPDDIILDSELDNDFDGDTDEEDDDNEITEESTKISEPDIDPTIEPDPSPLGHRLFSSAAVDVFSDMEDDIRRNMSVPQEQDSNISDSSVTFDGNHFENSSATNLTKDELSDFFNAQTIENTPKTQEIPPKPPKTNRATKKGPYIIPSDLLTAYKDDPYWIIDDETKKAALNLKQTLAEFNIEAEITGIKKGPVVTMFEILPAAGVKLSKIVSLQDNIALSLAAQSVRIVAPIPGKQAVGIEVPNKHRSIVGFREIIEMQLDEWEKMAIPVILGKDILGKAQLVDLAKTPHMLIAGATGSGKSVCVNSLILSILYKRSFNDVKLILVDPKVVELKLYNNIPHLITPVITEPKRALQALQWCLCEMERRYAMLDNMGVREISSYNQRIKERGIMQEKLPYIVVIIDEFADLMATSGRELETVIARLTAMSRAVGIHLVLATQRPSVNVITGLIKANIPSRIAFMVTSRTDSNIIIDTVGAEKLLGRGDMLYASAVDPAPVRIQGTFITDQEVEDVVNAVKEYGEPDYIDDEIFSDNEDIEDGETDLFGQPIDDDDPLYDQAVEIVVQAGKASASYLQRRLSIGYNRAARLVEQMEERGIVGPANGSKPRELIYVP